MPLNKEARIENITRVEEDKSKKVGTFKLEWNGESKYEDVYRIPIEYLVLTYTPKNGHSFINLLFHTHQVIYNPMLNEGV